MALRPARVRLLKAAFDSLAGADARRFVANDPIAFVHRYTDPRDQEIAAAVASALAFGRVSLFFPVVQALLDEADRHGGPRAYAEAFDRTDAATIAPLYYRWNRGADFALWIATLGRAVKEAGTLGAMFEAAHDTKALTIEAALESTVTTLLALAEDTAPRIGLPATLSRSFKTFLPRPSSGSACKRWNMLLRWMVRPADGVDLGLWVLPPEALVLPLDTHTHRIAQYVGLTARKDGSWRTASEITAALKCLDPRDPVRFDFALAHLGISGRCRRRYDAGICSSCALLPVCSFARRGVGAKVLEAAPLVERA